MRLPVYRRAKNLCSGRSSFVLLRLGLTLPVALVASSCKTTAASAVKDDSAAASSAAAGGSLIMQLNAAGSEMITVPVLKPSEVYTKLTPGGDDTQIRNAVNQMLHQVLAAHPPDVVRQILISSYFPEF